MKIAFITSWNMKCGIATYASDLYDSLKDKLDVNIFNISDYTNKNSFVVLAEDLNKSTCSIAHIQHTPSLFGGDRKHVNNFKLFIKHLKIPFIITLHEISRGNRFLLKNTSIKSIFINIKNIIFNVYKKYLLEPDFIRILFDAKKIIVHTDHQKQYLIQRGFNSSLTVKIIHGISIYNGGVQDEFGILKEQYNLKNKKVLLTFGFIKEFKNYPMVFETLIKLDENFVYIIAGSCQNEFDSIYEKKLKQLVVDKKLEHRVRFTGFLTEDDIKKYHIMADIVIFPYLHSVGSGALSKALSFEKVVLASNIPVHNEINNEAQNIIIYDNKDQLLIKIKDILENPEMKEQYQDNLKNYVAENSWQNVGIKTLNIYKDILK